MCKKKSIIIVILATTALLSLNGCSRREAPEAGLREETWISVHKDGSVTAVMTDSFEEAYYQLSELENMIAEEIAAFNEIEGADSIMLEEVKSEEGIINVVMTFSDSDYYADYMGSVFFMGKVSEAAEMGADLDRTLFDVQDMANTINGMQIPNADKTYILITDETMNISPVSFETFGRILYVSSGIAADTDNNTARAEGPTEALSYIVFE